jgi:hypothetical protein
MLVAGLRVLSEAFESLVKEVAVENYGYLSFPASCSKPSKVGKDPDCCERRCVCSGGSSYACQMILRIDRITCADPFCLASLRGTDGSELFWKIGVKDGWPPFVQFWILPALLRLHSNPNLNPSSDANVRAARRQIGSNETLLVLYIKLHISYMRNQSEKLTW